MRRAAPPVAPVLRLTIDRVVVRGGEHLSRGELTAAIEQAVSSRVAASPELWTGAAHGGATAMLRQPAHAGSSTGVADALASAAVRGLGGGR